MSFSNEWAKNFTDRNSRVYLWRDHPKRKNEVTSSCETDMGTVSLGDIRKCIPRECFEVSTTRSWFTLGRILVFLSICVCLESQISFFPLLLLCWLLHGQILVGLFVLGHDCGHHSFSKNRTTNLLVGHLCMSPLGNGLANWIITHNHHHAHTQLKGQDVDWSSWLMSEEEFRKSSWKRNFASRLGYKLPFGVFFWIWLNAIRRGLQKSTRAVMFSNVIMWTVMFGLYGALWYFTGPWGMMKYHGIPAFIAMVTGYYLLTIQHANNDSKWFTPQSWTPVRGQMEATFDVRFTRFLEWLWLDINIHTPHHVSPGIPWYHLRSASLSLKENFPELYQERRFTWNEVSWMVKSPKIRYLPEQDVFVMGSSSVK